MTTAVVAGRNQYTRSAPDLVAGPLPLQEHGFKRMEKAFRVPSAAMMGLMIFDVSHGVEGVEARDLDAFFVGWPSSPSLDRRLAILQGADEVLVARSEAGEVIGFITALTDGVFAASIPLLEALPDWQGEGVGSALVVAMLERLKTCYMIDLSCDDGVVPFYSRLGGSRLNSMAWRTYEKLAG